MLNFVVISLKIDKFGQITNFRSHKWALGANNPDRSHKWALGANNPERLAIFENKIMNFRHISAKSLKLVHF